MSQGRGRLPAHGTRRVRSALAAVVVALTAARCGESPSAPSSVAIQITCPPAVTAVATSSTGAAVTYQPPIASGGQPPLTVSCSTAAGGLFPVGLTQVTCTARDRTNQLAACAFDVRVTPPPQLSRTRFLAFGDSITAGEITTPSALPNGWLPLVVVPSSSYPTLLEQRLQSTYALQTPTVANAGYPGVAVGIAFNRFLSELTRVQPQVVLLVMGYNDLDNANDVAFGANVLDSMVRDAQVRGALVFIGTLTPTITGRPRSVNPALLDSMNVRIRRIAATRNAVLVDLFEGFQPAVFTWVGADGIHPTESGYVRIAELFFAAIRSTLEVATSTAAAAPAALR